MLVRSVTLSVAAFCIAAAIALPGRCETLSLRFQAAQLMGLRVGNQSLPTRGAPGGFYVQPYQLQTGGNLLEDAAFDKLPNPLPSGFAMDQAVIWQGKPTLAIKLPDDSPVDSGEMEFHAQNIKPHHIYLLRFAHRGDRLDGEFPPIVHARESDAQGQLATGQLNIELLCGSYDWKEETIAIPAVEGATSMSFMLHHPAGMGQFWMSEPTLEEVIPQPVALVPGLWQQEAGKPAVFEGTIPGADVALVASAQSKGDRISITASLAGRTERLREKPVAMVIGFRLPLDATGWRWGDYLHRDRVIEAGKDYSNYVLIGRRQFREISRFAIAPVSGAEHGLALMAPMNPPLLTRARYDHGGYLCVEFDIGMAARAQGEVETTGFSFDIARYQPGWGFRAALAKYYELYPQFFASAAKEGGWWIGPSQQVKDLTDFGLRYDEDHFAHPDRARADDQFGIYTCSYSEPWMWRITVSDENKLSLAEPLSAYLPGIEEDADLPASVMDTHDYWPAPRRDSVRAFLNSAIFGPDGQYQINAVRTYDGTFIEMNTSCLPRLRSERWGDMNRGLLSYKYETQADIARCAAGGAKVDGVYFDSVGNWPDISAEDHRTEHFQYATFPLTFSYATGKPVISGLSAMAEYMAFVREKGFVTMADSGPDYIWFAAPYLDMLGAGENFGEGVADDQALSHDRSIAYHKSVSFGNSGMLRGPAGEAEKRFRLLLFYHVYPGIFSDSVDALERARPVYRKYIPLMREMGRAGWEPIPWASADDPSVLVERYGPAAGGAVYFALRNPTDAAVASTLSIEPTGFGCSVAKAAKAVNALTGDVIPIRRVADELRLSVEVPAQDTAVVKVEWER